MKFVTYTDLPIFHQPGQTMILVPKPFHASSPLSFTPSLLWNKEKRKNKEKNNDKREGNYLSWTNATMEDSFSFFLSYFLLRKKNVVKGKGKKSYGNK